MSSPQSSPKTTGIVIISGGGTGGHIYPGVAIARAIEKAHPAIKVHFVGAQGGMEETIVPREGFPLHTIKIGKLHHSVGLLARIKTIVTMPFAFFRAVGILRELKPVAVLGVGGFASGPMLFVGSLLGYRTLIWEPNAYPGLANRLLSRFVDECLLVFNEAGRFLHSRKAIQVGLPVRASMVPVSRDHGPRPLRVLVFGGSQGAQFINTLVSQSMREPNGEWLEGVELVQQTGPSDFARIQHVYEGAPKSIQVFEYLHDMDKRYAWADIVVCRSGASTVAEICACQKAAIFIPLPSAADDHQTKNAQVLARVGAAVVMLQKNAGATLGAEEFRATLKRFRDNRDLVQKLEESVRQFQFPSSADKIVERVLA
jgi:UDP-N-acetylglucosamine--N-acetylmuramyl-(pentapeptide) pyrophosphoryl-undecaprenol N-acetylglucosamine transferase